MIAIEIEHGTVQRITSHDAALVGLEVVLVESGVGVRVLRTTTALESEITAWVDAGRHQTAREGLGIAADTLADALRALDRQSGIACPFAFDAAIGKVLTAFDAARRDALAMARPVYGAACC